jgi:hypothetical protein
VGGSQTGLLSLLDIGYHNEISLNALDFWQAKTPNLKEISILPV